ncbi:MAG: exodeoxyribonuclease V subunit alpha, partial [Candidatus Electrothrix sp. MAN1_4]|nr:exodeoxyribonuclease V subunit alpha [Candidatus Electrothrix sp. MAN1_4]
MHNQLHYACHAGEIRLLDLHIGLFLEKQANKGDKQQKYPSLLLAATLASSAVGNGHICYPLYKTPEQPMLADLVTKHCPDLEQWRKELLTTPVVDQPGTIAPLILDTKNHLYLHRFFCYEEFIAAALHCRALTQLVPDHQLAAQILEQLFPKTSRRPDTPLDGIDFQQMATALALLKPLVIISGGPGTGKTHTVARILAALQALHARQQQGQRKKALRIALAAPTGKAAARLEESIRMAKLSLPQDLRHDIPEQAQTLHRLLGSRYRPGASAFRFNRENKLYLDILILDEASMIDVEMMVSILEALPEKTRIILLGDRNQLASVEAGSLFADLCGNDYGNNTLGWSSQLWTELEQLTKMSSTSSSLYPPKKKAEQYSGNALTDSLILLRTSYRFQENSGIGFLAAAVKNGSTEQVGKVIKESFADLEIVQHTEKKRQEWLKEKIVQGFQPILTATSPEQALAAMDAFRFLCALRKGPDGVQGINALMAQVLRQAELIAPHTTKHTHHQL